MSIVKQKLFNLNGVLIFLLLINASYTIFQSFTYKNEINNLNNIIIQQSQQIKELDSKISNIDKIIPTSTEEKEPPLQFTTVRINSLSKPDYDSGWIPIEPDSTIILEHNMGYNIFVYILGWDDTEKGVVLHQDFQGINVEGDNTGCGLSWCCDKGDCISIHRMEKDRSWDEFRVYIWKIEY